MATELLVTLLIMLGCFTGTFPVQSPFVSRIKYKFCYCSLSFFLWLFVFSYDWINTIDVSHVLGFSFYETGINRTDKEILADAIMSSTMWFTQHSNAQILRLNFLFYCPLCLDLLKSLKICHFRNLELRTKISKIPQKQSYNKLYRPSHFVNLLLSNVLWFWSAVISTIDYQRYYTEENMKQFLTLPNNLLVNKISGAYVDLIPTFTIAFTVGFFVLLGLELVDALTDCAELIDTMWQPRASVVTIAPRRDTMKQFSIALEHEEGEYYNEIQETLLQLRASYNDYYRIIGLPAFIITFNATLNFVAVLYGWNTGGIAYVAAGTVASLLQVALFAHFGYEMMEQFQKVKEQLRITVLQAASSKHVGLTPEKNYQLHGITTWFLELEWELSAKGIYPVNHKMLPLLLSLGLTYMIFVFQLRSS